MNDLTSRAMLLSASSSAENRSFRGARFLPVPCVPMLVLELILRKPRRWKRVLIPGGTKADKKLFQQVSKQSQMIE